MSKTPIQLSDHFTCRKLICFTLPSITLITVSYTHLTLPTIA